MALQGTKFSNLWSEEVRGVFYIVCTINMESHTKRLVNFVDLLQVGVKLVSANFI